MKTLSNQRHFGRRYLLVLVGLLLLSRHADAQTPARTIFTDQTPAQPNATEGRSYELGIKFATKVDGTIQAIRYYKSPDETGTHTGTIWSADGQVQARVTFTGETASGWQQATLPTALSIGANTTYFVSVNANTHYAFTNGGLANPITNCSIGTVADGRNGVYGDIGTFPTNFYQNSHYFRDVQFVASTAYNCPTNPQLPTAFVHKSYLGWIRDLATEPRPNDEWPSIVIDEQLVRDYEQSYDMMRATGLNEVAIWGFFATRRWAVNIEQTIDEARARQVRDLINRAHAKGIKVIAGLGVYSWGFEDIIAANPDVGCPGNPQVLCPGSERAWQFQKRVIDYIFSFPVDGVTMQSGDQGRCNDCPGLAPLNDAEYHALLNDRVAAYIKQTYPGKIVGINTYGQNLSNPADIPAIKRMTAHADYLIDFNNSTLWSGRDHRRAVVAAIQPCYYGSLGLPFHDPPLHWDRERWFLPKPKRVATKLQELFADGGRAVENFMHILANPGDEVTIKLAAAVENDPSTPWEPKLKAILRDIYAPADETAATQLVDLFVGAEDAYYNNPGTPDILDLEPLVSRSVGPPIYLTDYLKGNALLNYKNELCRLRGIAKGLINRVGNPDRLQTVWRCLGRVIADIDGIRGETTPCAGEPPVVRMTSPSDNAQISTGSSLTLTAEVTASAGASITRVDFYQGSTVLGTDDTAPYSYVWTNVPAGTYTLKAIAFEGRQGGSAQSAPVNITVAAGSTPASGQTLFTTQTPTAGDFTENRSYELGLKFQSSQAGQIVALRYYKAPSETGNHTGRLWSICGTLLASVAFTSETASGWQQATLATPMPILPNTTYVVSVNANTHYVATVGSLNSPVQNGGLSSVADGRNGVYGDIGTFPLQTYQNAHYFRDVVFSTASGGRTAASLAESNAESDRSAIRLFPNPSDGNVQVEVYAEQPQLGTVQVTNLSGEVVHTTRPALNAGWNRLRVPLPLSDGVYLLNVSRDGKQISGKVVLRR